MSTAIPAINAFIVNQNQEILLLKEKGSDSWLALSGLIKDQSKEEALIRKSEKELNLKIENPIFFDSGLVAGVMINRYLITDYSGEIKLLGKYGEYRWIKLSEVADLENVCPYVQAAVSKIINIMKEVKKGIYLHYKGAKYRVLYEAKHSETEESLVVYQNIEAEDKIWVRPKQMFQEEVEIDGVKKPRFEFLEEENNSWEHKCKLALADYQNLLKKTAADKTEFAKYAIADLLEDIIPVYDHLKMSLAGLPEEEGGNAWVTGVKYVLKQFKEALENRGVEEIKTIGEKFDHNTMEALEGEGEVVAKEIMPGYKLNGRLIKAAKVVVS
jgi:molecular chaperone GrpE (heat shock protein)